MKDRIGISGGTFDPIHVGHLLAAEQVREAAKLKSVIFIPTGKPHHKPENYVSEAYHRLEMVRMAIEGNPFFSVSKIEIERIGYTYTIDTMQRLNEIYGNNVEFHYIIGADVVYDINKWKSFEKVSGMCKFVALLRAGHNKEILKERVEFIKEKYAADISIFETPVLEISSTDVRKRVKEGRSVRYMVPEKVEKYIIENRLYKNV